MIRWRCWGSAQFMCLGRVAHSRHIRACDVRSLIKVGGPVNVSDKWPPVFCSIFKKKVLGEEFEMLFTWIIDTRPLTADSSLQGEAKKTRNTLSFLFKCSDFICRAHWSIFHFCRWQNNFKKKRPFLHCSISFPFFQFLLWLGSQILKSIKRILQPSRDHFLFIKIPPRGHWLLSATLGNMWLKIKGEKFLGELCLESESRVTAKVDPFAVISPLLVLKFAAVGRWLKMMFSSAGTCLLALERTGTRKPWVLFLYLTLYIEHFCPLKMSRTKMQGVFLNKPLVNQ